MSLKTSNWDEIEYEINELKKYKHIFVAPNLERGGSQSFF